MRLEDLDVLDDLHEVVVEAGLDAINHLVVLVVFLDEPDDVEALVDLHLGTVRVRVRAGVRGRGRVRVGARVSVRVSVRVRVVNLHRVLPTVDDGLRVPGQGQGWGWG